MNSKQVIHKEKILEIYFKKQQLHISQQVQTVMQVQLIISISIFQCLYF